jgi:hypothetical protein
LADLTFGAPVDLTHNELRNVVIQPLGADPSDAVEAQLWYRTDLHVLRQRQNGVNVTVGALDSEGVQDIVGAMLGTTTGITVTYNDAAGTITFAVTDSPLFDGHGPAYYLDRAHHTGAQTASTISDFNAAVDARVALIVDAAPATLDTLNELAAALGDDPTFAATTAAALGALDTRLDAVEAAGGPVKCYETVLVGGATSEVVTHNLGSSHVDVVVRSNVAPYARLYLVDEATDDDHVTIRGGANLPAGYTVTVFGRA